MRDPARVALPPVRLLDDRRVHDVVESWQAAAKQHEQLQRDRYHAEQVELVEALSRIGGPTLRRCRPGGDCRSRRRTRAGSATGSRVGRHEQAAETIKSRAHTHLLEVLEAAKPKLAESAAGRREAALAEYRQAVDKLDEAVGALAETQALVEWAAEPTARMWKVRGLLTAIIGPNGDRLAVPALVDQLRTVGRPPPKPVIPSPFPVVTEAEQAPAA